MDELYNKKEAAKRLSELSEEAVFKFNTEHDYIATVASVNWPESLQVESFGKPASYRLVAKKPEEEDEEIVFIMHGVLVRKDLPPIEKPLGKNSKAGYMAQQVVLTGFGCSVFENAMGGINTVEKQFRRNLDDDEVEDHKIFGLSDGFSTVELSNRYVTSIRNRRNACNRSGN
ncbi:hypothetical protein V5O48_007888 [Marasmius crinis-equi]|uniref:Uncharacterized protein n=1 Tax=Marasmius crinis-equi TaxID=585013 RepID=A0ABR3FFZ8_9AGAR